jgi:hypothetical protein
VELLPVAEARAGLEGGDKEDGERGAGAGHVLSTSCCPPSARGVSLDRLSRALPLLSPPPPASSDGHAGRCCPPRPPSLFPHFWL